MATVFNADQDLLLRQAAARLCVALRDVLRVRERAVIAVPGGRSVARVFECMRREELAWSRVHFFMVDERLVPADHPDSNFRLLREHLIEPLQREGRLDAGAGHPFPLDMTSADRGAGTYDRTLADYGSRFDVVLLSAGEDGHVASLFPNHPCVRDERHGFLVMDDAPKPPPGRVTASASLVRTAGVGVLLFLGRGKGRAYEMFLDPAVGAVSCPAKLVLETHSPFVFTDLT